MSGRSKTKQIKEVDLNNQVVLSIEHAQRIQVATNGIATREFGTYIKKYAGLLHSGLLARLTGNANKILDALGLRARILSDPARGGSEKEFQDLERLGVVRGEDRGRLFCFVSEEQIGADTGISSRNTVRTSTQQLIDLKLIDKVAFRDDQLRLSNGRFGSTLYFINPASHISKFEESHDAQKSRTVSHRAQKSRTVTVRENRAPTRENRALKILEEKEEKEDANSVDIISEICGHFARAIGAERYEPTEKECRRLMTLRADGFSVEEICAGITRAVTLAAAKGQVVRALAYCIPEVRNPTSERDTETRTLAQTVVTRAGTSKPTAVAGKPQTESEPALGKPRTEPQLTLDELAEGNAELRDLLELVQERNPGRVLGKSDVRAWLAMAEKYPDLASARGVTPVQLVKQAVLHGIGAQSDRGGYFTATLAEAILENWQQGATKPAPARKNGPNSSTAKTPTAPAPESKYPSDAWRFAKPEKADA